VDLGWRDDSPTIGLRSGPLFRSRPPCGRQAGYLEAARSSLRADSVATIVCDNFWRRSSHAREPICEKWDGSLFLARSVTIPGAGFCYIPACNFILPPDKADHGY